MLAIATIPPVISLTHVQNVVILSAPMADSFYKIWAATSTLVLNTHGNLRILFVRGAAPTVELVNELESAGNALVFCREQTTTGQRLSYDWWSAAPHKQLSYSAEDLANPFGYGDVCAFSIRARDLIKILDELPTGIKQRNDGHNIQLATYARALNIPVRLSAAALIVGTGDLVMSATASTSAPITISPSTRRPTVAAGAKLHIGCGGKLIKGAGWLNTDCVASNGPDGVVDLQNLRPLPSDTYGLVYASHVLEHIYHEETPKVLGHLYRILQSGGTLRLSVPDLRLIVANCVESHTFGPDANAPLFGDYRKHAAGYDRHWQVFWRERLELLLIGAGFERARTWSTEQYPEIAAIHDWAAYKTISLNLEADKPGSASGESAEHLPEVGSASVIPVSQLSALPENRRVMVSVLLGTVDRPQMLQDCITTIRESVGDLSYEIVVAHGTDADLSLPWLREQKDVKLVLGGIDGAIEAFNRGYAACSGEYICQLNDDLLVVDAAIASAINHLTENSDVGGVVFQFNRNDGLGFRHDLLAGKLHPNQMVVRREVCELVVEKLGAFWGDRKHRTDKTYGGDSAFGTICHHYGVKLVSLDNVKCIDRMLETNDALRNTNADIELNHGQRWHMMYPASMITSVELDAWQACYTPAPGVQPRQSPISAGRPLRIFHLGLFSASEPLVSLISAFKAIGPYIELSWPELHAKGTHVLSAAVLAAIRDFRPEIIWMQVQDIGFDLELLRAMREVAGAECTIINWSGDVRTAGSAQIASWMVEFAKHVDLMLFSNCTYAEQLSALGLPSRAGYMQCGYDPVVNQPQGIEVPGIVFAGGSHLSNFGSRDRVDMCLAVNRALPDQLVVYGSGDWHKDLSARPRIDSATCAREYATRQVVLSISLFHDLRRYTSDRLKRALGCGAVVAMRSFDDYEGLGIVDGQHAMVWETHVELIEELQYLLDSPAARTRMRAAAHALAVTNFTWPVAVAQMMAIVRHYRRSKGLA